MGVKVDVVFWWFLLFWGRGLATLLLFLYVTEEAGRIYVLDMPWPPAAECNMITNKQTLQPHVPLFCINGNYSDPQRRRPSELEYLTRTALLCLSNHRYSFSDPDALSCGGAIFGLELVQVGAGTCFPAVVVLAVYDDEDAGFGVLGEVMNWWWRWREVWEITIVLSLRARSVHGRAHCSRGSLSSVHTSMQANSSFHTYMQQRTRVFHIATASDIYSHPH